MAPAEEWAINKPEFFPFCGSPKTPACLKCSLGGHDLNRRRGPESGVWQYIVASSWTGGSSSVSTSVCHLPYPPQPLSRGYEWGCGDWRVSKCPCHRAFPVLACLPPMAMGLTLHRLGLWELTPTAAQVKPQCINGALVYPGRAHKMLRAEPL